MPVTVVVGGQFGSEGKGKVAHYLARELGATAAVRVGGPNSGHTVVGPEGRKIIFRQLPTASILPDIVCVLPAGSYVDKEVLFREVRLTGLGPD
jgi:adenylosuccinate synthase